jgi:hypothetical protein
MYSAMFGLPFVQNPDRFVEFGQAFHGIIFVYKGSLSEVLTVTKAHSRLGYFARHHGYTRFPGDD